MTGSDDTITKRCSRCREIKPLNAFSRHGQSRDGRFSYCRDCNRRYEHQRAAKRGITRTTRRALIPGMKWCPDCAAYKPVAEFGRNRSQGDGLTGYCKTHQQDRVYASKQRGHGGWRNDHLLRRYGISATEVDLMIQQQHGLCAV